MIIKNEMENETFKDHMLTNDLHIQEMAKIPYMDPHRPSHSLSLVSLGR